MIDRRSFIRNSALAGAGLVTGGVAAAEPVAAGGLAWGMLMHFGGNMWGGSYLPEYTKMPSSPDEEKAMFPNDGLNKYGTWPSHIRGYLRFDEAVWREETAHCREAGMNMVVIDVGESLVFPSHPELAVNGSWSPDRYRAELRRLRSLGLEPIPKLNFSSCHHAWLKHYGNMLGTRRYYQVVEDVIADVAEVFDTPRYFHIGYDEEMWTAQKTRTLVMIRQGELWWHDFLHAVAQVEKAGSRAMCWSDAYWTGRDEFKKRMPKSVLQENWYYGDNFSPEHLVWNEKFEKEGGWGEGVHGSITFLELEQAGYDQLPCTGNFWGRTSPDAVVRFCRDHIDPSRLKGFLCAPWGGTTEAEKPHFLDGLGLFAEAKRRYYGT